MSAGVCGVHTSVSTKRRRGNGADVQRECTTRQAFVDEGKVDKSSQGKTKGKRVDRREKKKDEKRLEQERSRRVTRTQTCADTPTYTVHTHTHVYTHIYMNTYTCIDTIHTYEEISTQPRERAR